ncbi:hypothetical protein DQ04_11221020, partial [Trypanosoma grayi]|uniref:hypothetical protein n=1 Tax=Trypanosoma grayi TaxID=71804 RepID=UPI0004F47BA6
GAFQASHLPTICTVTFASSLHCGRPCDVHVATANLLKCRKILRPKCNHFLQGVLEGIQLLLDRLNIYNVLAPLQAPTRRLPHHCVVYPTQQPFLLRLMLLLLFCLVAVSALGMSLSFRVLGSQAAQSGGEIV